MTLKEICTLKEKHFFHTFSCNVSSRLISWEEPVHIWLWRDPSSCFRLQHEWATQSADAKCENSETEKNRENKILVYAQPEHPPSREFQRYHPTHHRRHTRGRLKGRIQEIFRPNLHNRLQIPIRIRGRTHP